MNRVNCITDDANYYPLSNAYGVSKVIKTLGDLRPRRAPNKVRTALLVGQSSFCSMLPELRRHYDVVMFVDLHPLILEHNHFLLQGLLTQSTPQDFRRYYAKYGDKFQTKDIEPCDVLPDIEMREDELGDEFFLSSLSRYQACAKAARQIRYGYVPVNLFDKAQVKKITSSLKAHQAQVTFFNATNLYEWDASTPLQRVNASLPWQPLNQLRALFKEMGSHPIIMHSIRKDPCAPCDLKAKLCFHYQDLIKKNRVPVLRKLVMELGEQEALKNYPKLFNFKKS